MTRETGLAGLLKMAADLRKEHFDYIYDAHSNIRSNILKLIVAPLPFAKPYVALRSKERGKRFLLFKLGINHFDKPFRGMVSFQKPLKKWGITHFPDTYRDWHFPDEIRSRYEDFHNQRYGYARAVCQLGNETLARCLLESVGRPSS